MRRVAACIIASLALVAAGCGGDDDGGSSSSTQQQTTQTASGSAGADKFVSCFQLPGYEAVHPASGEESFFAAAAKQHGFENVPVNVNKKGVPSGDAFLIFFDSAEDAGKALDEVNLGEESAKPLVRGAVVVGFLDEESRTKTLGAIERCL